MNTPSRLGFFAALLILGVALAAVVTTPVQANSGICDRTQQVKDAILAKLSDVSDCANVTDANLNGIAGEIIINDNDELTLQDGDFEGLSDLDTLYVHHNGLTALPEDVFDGLSALTALYLYNNKLTTLPSDLFDSLSNLETLSLSYNGMTTLPSDVFDGLSSLTTLDLASNSIGEIPEGLFDELWSLEKLDLTSNSLEDVAADDFSELNRLKDLRLAGNNLGELPGDLFNDMSDVETLHLYSAGLNELPDGLFHGVTALQNLIVHGNPGAPFTLTATLEDRGAGRVSVRVAEATPFDMEVTLSVEGGTLSTSAVSITAGEYESELITVTQSSAGEDVTITVESATFQEGYSEGVQTGLGEAFSVSFAGIGICDRTQEVQDAILASLPNVSDCANVTDTDLNSVIELDLSQMEVTSLKAGDFAGLSDLLGLSLEDNQLTTIPEDIFDGLGNLLTLSLSGNQITKLPEDTFDGLTSMWVLDLSDNGITALEEDIFDGLGSLHTLLMAHNQISGLPSDVFDGLDWLFMLELNNNQIAALPDGIFDGNSFDLLYLGKNPGAPFTFTAELKQQGNDAVVVEVAKGAPSEMSVSLSAEGGLLSTETVSVAPGSTESDPITVTPSGDSEVTISVDSAEFVGVSFVYDAQTGLGDSLTLTFVNSESTTGNSPATGLPTITGTAQVGQTLTAGTTGISDSDGLTNVSYSYQWLADDSEIDGATSSTYTVQTTDNGKVIKVQVTFTDDGGSEESLTSVGTSAVVLGGL